jgi:PncC family amidohydrolase
MQTLIPLAETIAALLVAKKQTVAIAESSSGGLISAALLAVPGASKYFLGGAVVYTREARRELLQLPPPTPPLRSATEPYVLLHAHRMREKFGATWALAEAGAAGPPNEKGLGNVYGDASGHSCFAIVGEGYERAMTIETGLNDRAANMIAFAEAGLTMLLADLQA